MHVNVVVVVDALVVYVVTVDCDSGPYVYKIARARSIGFFNVQFV